MKLYVYFASMFLSAGFAPIAASAQTISVTVQNQFGQTIGLYGNTCVNSSCTPTPPASIASGATSASFGAATGSGQTNPGITTKWSATKSGQQYGCQFEATTGFNGATCQTPVVSANSFAGVYPSPTCKKGTPTQQPYPSCSLSVTFAMAP